MGWLSDAWDWLVGKVSDFVHWLVDPIVQWVKDVVAWVAELKYRFVQKIAEWMQTDLGFILIVGAAVAAIIFVPKIMAWFSTTALKGQIDAIIKWIKDSVGTLAAKLHIIEWKLVSDILVIFWEDYRLMILQLNNAIAGFAEFLGLGSSMLTAIYGSTKGVYYSLGTILGSPGMMVEAAFYEDVQKSLAVVDEKFQEYYANPGKILDDFIEGWVLPTYQNSIDVNSQQTEDIYNTQVRLHEISDEIEGITIYIDQAIAALPDEIAAQINIRWIPFRDGILTAIEDFRTEFLIKFDEVAAVWTEYISTQEKIIAIVDERTKNQKDYLFGIEMLPVIDRNQVKGYIAGIVAQANDMLTEEEMAPVMKILDPTNKLSLLLIGDIQYTPSMSYEPAGLVSLPTSAKALKRDWFVGEF